VIDGATDSVLATVPAMCYPNALCYNKINNKVYCADYSGATIVIDGATDRVIATVYPSSPYPVALCYNPTDNRSTAGSWAGALM